MSIAIVYSAIITYETIIQYDNFTLERFSANSLVSSREQLINTGKQVISEFNLTEVLLGKGISGGRFAVASIYDPEEKVKNIESDFYDIILSFGFVLGGFIILAQLFLVFQFIRPFFIKKKSEFFIIYNKYRKYTMVRNRLYSRTCFFFNSISSTVRSLLGN